MLYLAVQIRHSAAEVRANTSQIILSASIENRSDIASGPLALIVDRQIRGERLDEEELARYGFFHQHQMEIFQNAYIQYQAGRLDPEIYRMIEVRSLGPFTNNLRRSLWQAAKGAYLPNFVRYVDTQIADGGR